MRSHSDSRLVRLLCRTYDVLLSGYPSDFRQHYADEMRVAFRDQLRDVMQAGTWALVPFLLHTSVDWLTTVIQERTDMRPQQIARVVAALQLVMIAPAALFMMAVVVRYVPLLHDGAQRIVMSYAGKVWTLWLLLLALPLCVLCIGGMSLLRDWSHDTELPNTANQSAVVRLHDKPSALGLVGALTFAAAGILTTVVLHMLAS